MRPNTTHRIGHRREALVLDLFERRRERLAPPDDDLLGLLFADLAHLHQALDVDLPHRRLLIDHLVHLRLRVTRLVALVVAEAPVAVHVDDDVLREALPVVDREVGDLGDGLGILAVHVEDGAAEQPHQVGRVARAARVARLGGEADLVVDDDVNRPAGRVAREAGEVQRLGVDALADERGVAVDEERHHLGAGGGVAAAVLLGADSALDDRVHELEVARVEGERHVDALAAHAKPIGRVAEVVFHVARAEELLGVLVFEGGEDLAQALVEDVGEDVEAAAVRHPEDDLLHVLRGGALDQEIEERDQALGALEREALGAELVAPVDELLEDLRVAELGQDPELLAVREREPVLRRLHPVLEPKALVAALDLGVLDADRSAVRLLEPLDDLAERLGRRAPGEVDGRELLDRDRRAERPKLRRSSSGGAVGGTPSGSRCAKRWPRTRYAFKS